METAQGTTVSAARPLERRFDLAVAMSDIEREVEQQLRRIAKTAKMDGFRPGKAPMKVVARMYGEQARSEAIGAAIEKAFSALVRERNLRVASQPRIEPKAAGAEDRMEFTAVFEVFPEFQIAEIADKRIEKPVLTVTDVEVDKTIEALRRQRATYLPAERPAEKGDRLIIDFTSRKNGETFDGGRAADYPVFVGSGMMLPDFEAALEGVTVGQEKTFDVRYPEDHYASDLAGSTVEFSIVVKSVEKPQLPRIDAEFARSLGIADGDLEKMRAEVRANLEREVAKRLRRRVKDQVMNILLEANPIEVPQAMVEAEARQLAEIALRDLKSRNPQMKDPTVAVSWFTDEAIRRVKLGLIIAELVRAKDLHAKPEQVRAVVDEFAAAFENPREVVRWYYSNPDRLAQAEALAVENNVVDWVLANAKTSEVPISLDELMGDRAV